MGYTWRSAVVLFVLGLFLAPARADGPVYAQATAPTVGGTCSTRPPIVDQANHRVYVCESSVWKIRDLPECNLDPPTTPSCAANARPMCQLTSVDPPELWGCNSSNAWTQMGGTGGTGDEITVDGTAVGPVVQFDKPTGGGGDIDFYFTDGTPDIVEANVRGDSIGSAEIIANTITAADIAATLTWGSADLLDFSAITGGTLNTGLRLPQSTACSLASATEGMVCWDTLADKFYIGTGAAYKEIGGGTGDVTGVGDCLGGDCFNGVADQLLCFGDNAADDQTCLSSSGAVWAADNTVTVPGITGNMCVGANTCGTYAQGLDLNQDGTNQWFKRTTPSGSVDGEMDINADGISEFIARRITASSTNLFYMADGSCTGTCPNTGWYCYDSATPAIYACDTAGGTWAAVGAAGSGDVTAVGPGCASGACFTDGLATTGANAVVWEGTSVDTNEWTMAVPSNPAADYTVTWPSATGAPVLAPNTTYPITQCATWNGSGQLIGSGAACAGVPSTPDWAKLGIDYDANGTDPDLDMDDTRNNSVADIRRALVDVGHDGTDNLSIRQGSVLYSADGDDVCDVGDVCADVILARPATNAHRTQTGYKSIALTTSDDPYDYAGWIKLENQDGYTGANVTCGGNGGGSGSCSFGTSGNKIGNIQTAGIYTDAFVYYGTDPLSVGTGGIKGSITSPYTGEARWTPYGATGSSTGWQMYSVVADYRFKPGIGHNFEATSTAERWAGVCLGDRCQGRDYPEFGIVRETSATYNKVLMQSGSGQPWIVLDPSADTIHLDTDGSGGTQPGYYFCNDTTRTNGDVLTFRTSDSCITTEAPGGLPTASVDIGQDGTNDYTGVPTTDITGDGTNDFFPPFMKWEYWNDFTGDSVATEHWLQSGTTGAACGATYSYADNTTANATGAIGVTNVQPGTTAGNDCLVGLLSNATNSASYEVRKMRQFVVRYRNQTAGTTMRKLLGGFNLNTSVDYTTSRTAAYFICEPTRDMNDDGAVGTLTDLEWWAVTANAPTTSLSCNGTTGTSAINGTGGCTADAARTATATGVNCTTADTVMKVFKIWWDGTNMNFKVDNATTIQISTNIPANGNRVSQWGFAIEATSTTASLLHTLDYVYFNGVRN